ncbi:MULTISPECIES: ABC transporter ATP-binding protein [Staphylococcus]|uniref:ABC transporter ATP-binding protein n=1 Tax=Staphylococcus TaxID=1279 RepID=UPI00031C4B37|nr:MULTISPECIES: ATP-binding cassette domain-containing protein [Staphylococcus]MBC3048293.1 ABC transporter ATP-binding protein [Staphylococcus capitis]MBC3068920.1 ABC transporter ATP-binding protein [Staphylococcus capitis]MBC3071106.1 ABC transporter ATP-binding protein [Staphylococcus capitis]MBC3081387.1 ABC transporter ATP-binding protein [Staphylococcus capitis]MBO0371255.1 ABC transporter ATP-binding protein [Staphylococcus capitis]
MENKSKVFCEVKNISKTYNFKKFNEKKALNNVSFKILKGETFGIVGESGCGKSTLGKIIINLINNDKGEIIFDNQEIHNLKRKKDILKLNKRIQMIFQDPYASLNPRMKIMDIVAEGIDIHNLAKNKSEREQRVYELLAKVGLNKEHANRYPHEFSGGQRQRIGIARALAVEPEFIIADEPISALDVSIQAQIINLLLHLQEQEGLTILFIAHDLSMVKYISDRVAVMHAGEIVEIGSCDEIFMNPLHEYTKSLFNSIPKLDPNYEKSRINNSYEDIDQDTEKSLYEINSQHFILTTEKRAKEILASKKIAK